MEAQNRADEHDHGIVAADERRQRGADQFGGRGEVEVHDPSERVGREILKAADGSTAGSRDNAVDPTEPFGSRGDQSRAEPRVADVAGEVRHGYGDGPGEVFKPLLTPGGREHPRPAASQFDRDGATDSRGGARHDESFAGNPATAEGHEVTAARGVARDPPGRAAAQRERRRGGRAAARSPRPPESGRAAPRARGSGPPRGRH